MKNGLFITSVMLLLLVFLTKYAVSGDKKAEAVSLEQIRQNIHRTQENSQTTVRALTGRWRGKAKWTATYDYYPSPVKCKYNGTFILNLRQNQNNVTGNARTKNTKLSGDEDCFENLSPSGAVSFTVFGSGFSGTVGGLISINDGQFTSDTMRGSFSGDVGGGVMVRGTFKASRVSK